MMQISKFLSLIFLIILLAKCSVVRNENNEINYPNKFKLDKNIPNAGAEITSKGELKALFIFVMFGDDTLTQETGWKYNLTKLPTWANNFVNKTNKKKFTSANLSHYFYEMSRGNFLLYGDVYPKVVVPDSAESKYKSISEVNYEILKNLDKEIDFSKYDNWTRISKGNYLQKPDGNVDMIFLIYRNFSNRLFFNQGWTGSALFYLTKNIKTNDGVTIKTGTLHSGSGIQQRAGKHGFNYTKYIAAHEFAHFLFGGGHLRFVTNLSLLVANLWNESRGMHSWERAKLNWIKFKDVPLNTNSTFTVDDYITTGDALRIKLNESEWYLIENHQKLSPNDWSGDKGIYIYHVTRAQRFPPSIYVECADGNWDFKINTTKKELIKTTPNKKGKNETNFFKRKKGTNYACYEEVYEDNSAWGDQYDAFDLTYNNLFSPVSNPPVSNRANKNFIIEIKNKLGNKYSIKILFNNIYQNTPPSKPQIFKIEKPGSPTPVLVWLPNEEPDLKKYIVKQISPSDKIIRTVPKSINKLKLIKLNKNSKLPHLFTVIAVDADGRKSLNSNLISIKWNNKKKKWNYTLLEKN